MAIPSIYSPAQIAEYEAYLEFIGNNPDAGFPVPKDFLDYRKHRDEWAREYAPTEEEAPPPEEPPPGEEVSPGEEPPPEEPEHSEEDYREYYTYRNYASAYGDPSDWYPLNIADYFANWDISQEQLTEWKTEETARETEQTEYEQEREEAEREREEAERYDLSPLEAALRRQESYEYGKWARAQSKYGAQEAYRETPEYGKQLYGWMGGQEAKSEPLQQWMRAMFPTFQREYEADLPRLTGFPTREAARTEATKREAGLEQWLSAQESALEERFYMQRPYERGERPSLFAPRLREVSY